MTQNEHFNARTNVSLHQASLPAKDESEKSPSESQKLVQDSPFKAPKCQLKLVPLLLHAADISNPAKP